MDRLAADRPPALEGANGARPRSTDGPRGAGRSRTPAGGQRDGPSGPMATGASAGAQAPSRFITGGATRRRTTTEPGPPKGGSTACLGLSPPQSQGRGASAVRPPTGSRGAGAAGRAASVALRIRNRFTNEPEIEREIACQMIPRPVMNRPEGGFRPVHVESVPSYALAMAILPAPLLGSLAG